MNTKQKILLAALEVFADKGYKNTTTRDICSKIKMNTAAVNYHFSTKIELYRQVFIFMFENSESLTPNVNINFESIEDWKHSIKTWILDFLLSLSSDSPLSRWKSILIAREMAEPSEIFPWLFTNFFKPSICFLEKHFLFVSPKNTPKENIYFETFSLLSQCLFYIQNKSLSETVLGNDFYNDKNIHTIADIIYNGTCMKFSVDSLTSSSLE